ncbi:MULTISPECIES: hypothetical protein [Enterobacter]|uniref:hypothetical protein n=1 Tax=Enterobacter TaxID=547 RepID=UPI00177AE0E5|nr:MULTISPECIES: hypothetical protein [Enterobacter]MBD8852748.1 hypothetical protein [Enterobacter hormaechei]MBQ0311416.1 hypothetical protein [Enterobacter ludwigii]MCK7419819.1 hypothetical protein [Enterobacter asburiae]MEA5163766.1 hypothetical protein [Enterobacter bugandensis]
MSNQARHLAEQAVVAIFGALKDAGADLEKIAGNARANILDSSSNYQVHGDHAIITEACEVISDAEKNLK